MTETYIVRRKRPYRTNSPDCDDSLVRAAANGDHSAFEVLVQQHRRKILRIAQRITGRLEDAEDITQQAFMNAFVHLPEFAGRSTFTTWLVRIALNEAFMWKRKSRKLGEVCLLDLSIAHESRAVPEIPDNRPDQESSYLQEERRCLLLSAIDGLRPAHRMALRICDLEGQSVTSSASLLGVSVAAVKSRRSRGRRILRDRLGHCLSTQPGHADGQRYCA